MESRPLNSRVPDQSLILEGQGKGGEYAAAFRDSAGTYAMIYLPVGKTITVNTAPLKKSALTPWWFNPRTGKAERAKVQVKAQTLKATPPEIGGENDWVLVLDANKFRAPGQ